MICMKIRMKWSLKVQYLIRIQSKCNYQSKMYESISRICFFMMNTMLLLISLYPHYNKHARWIVLERFYSSNCR